MKRAALALALLLAFGALRLGFEHDLTARQRRAFFHGATLSLALREQIGQGAFIAALGGFRAAVADLLWLRAHAAWQRTEWGRMKLLFDQVTALQPRVLLFWDMAAWHMAWNASIATLNDPRQPRATLRLHAARQYVRLGEDYLARGIRNNPDRGLLHQRLGLLYREKLGDHCAAAAEYDLAARFPDAPGYMERFAAYELAACPGKEREAYGRLRALYLRGEQERRPTLLKLLAELAEKLGVPPAERVYSEPLRER